LAVAIDRDGTGQVFSCAVAETLGTPSRESSAAANWTRGSCSAVTKHGQPWIVDAYRGDGRRYIVESEQLLSAFLELETDI